MKSMTGFGRGSSADDGLAVSVELKTVNNRFLDVNLRLPGELQALETSIRRQISNRLSRGRVDATFSLERTAKITYELNRPLIAGYLAALREMQTEFELAGEPDINVIAKLPGVLQIAREELSESAHLVVEKAIEQALDELEAMRSSEGESLQAELFSRLAEIERQVAVIEPETGAITENYRLKLNKKIADLLQKTETQIELDQARIAQEAAFLAERSDISEELTRLKSHVAQFREISASETDAGKRLDFLIQELNREANTILSKSIDLKIKDAALSVKAEIEKLREQIQNVE